MKRIDGESPADLATFSHNRFFLLWSSPMNLDQRQSTWRHVEISRKMTLTFVTYVIRFLQQGQNPCVINIFLDHGRDMGSSASDVMHLANTFKIVD